ncbi:histidine kinase [Flavobacterium sp.]|uniref:histidine kinase n=1 Tax=Flavobacterium sp. TaxID=239 RepID=UPI002630B31D|nr:histidine kinase [Flavobacterium sp.]
MKFPIKNTISRRTFLITSLIVIVITTVAVFILSNLITQITEKSNEEIAQRSFLKKYEVLQQEFGRLLEQKKNVQEVLKISNDQNIINNLTVLNAIQLSNPVILCNWFQINNGTIYTNDTEKGSFQKHLNLLVDPSDKDENSSILLKQGDTLIWRNYFKIKKDDATTIRYGYDIDLKKLHDYFALIDGNAPNYAFVFDQNGTCIFHPEAEKNGKNIFDFTSLNPSDTLITNKSGFNETVALSEYLQLDVIRFVKPLKLEGINWYVCINFPKMIADENVNKVKQHASAIYLITTFILVFIFYLFNRANRKEYLEKEALVSDKNNLLLENEKVHKENALIQLQQLKEQINPHFLFNTLNSLYMLIDVDAPKAKKFTLNLSKIYRYLIDPPQENIVPLSDELSFIEQYIFLQMTRFNQELQFSIEIDDDSGLIKNIPYLSLQICIENVIKHNLATIESPLKSRIIVKKDAVFIINNLQKKTSTEQSNNFGLKYLQSIYNYYSKKDFKTFEENGEFICILPLID